MTSIVDRLKEDLEACGECVILANVSSGFFAAFPSTWRKRTQTAKSQGREGPNLIVYRTESEDPRDHHVIPYAIARQVLLEETLSTSSVDASRRWNLTLKDNRLHVTHRSGGFDVKRYHGNRLLVEDLAGSAFDMFSSLEIGRRYDRPELAHIWGFAGHQAISRGVVTPKERREIILFVTRLKQLSMRQYEDSLSADTLYWEGEDGHGNDQRIIGASDAGDQIYLFYRLVHHSPFEYKGRVELISFDQNTDKPSEFVFRLLVDQTPGGDIERAKKELDALKPTERKALAKARLGQGRFRRDLFSMWKGCAVTGVRVPEVLRASHIKPWRHSDNRERLDPYNGLLLLPQYDALFDKGLVGFEEDGSILMSRAMQHQDLELVGISPKSKLRFVAAGHQPYLAYHRDRVLVE